MNLTMSEIVELLEVPESKVTRWIERDGLPATLIHGAWQVHRAELFDWASTHGLTLPRRFFDSKGGIDDGPDFAGALRTGAVHVFPTPPDRAAAARAIARCLDLADPHETELAAGAIAARPALGFVALRDGLAVPLLSSPLIEPGPPAISACRFEAPFRDAEIGAGTFFVVRAPTVHLHHLLVEDLYAALYDATFRGAALRGAPLTGVLDGTPRPPRSSSRSGAR